MSAAAMGQPTNWSLKGFKGVCIKNLFLTKLSMIMKSVRSYVAFLATLSIVLMTSCSENDSISPTGKVNLLLLMILQIKDYKCFLKNSIWSVTAFSKLSP